MRSLTKYRLAAVVAATTLLLTACAPGGNSEAGPVPSKPATTGVGTEPVTLKLLVNSGVDVPFYTALGELVHAKYANVTVKVENQDYARRLQTAGVPVELHEYAGQIHGFFEMFTVMTDSHHAIGVAGDAVRRAFQSIQPSREFSCDR